MTGAGVPIVAQRNSADCGLAALAMLLQRPYRDVRRAADREYPSWRSEGLGPSHLQHLARTLGAALRRVARHRSYLSDAVGIVIVRSRQHADAGHWVYYHRGTIVDPLHGGTFWPDALDFMLHHGARPATLLTVIASPS